MKERDLILARFFSGLYGQHGASIRVLLSLERNALNAFLDALTMQREGVSG